MARKSRTAVLKRQREAKKAEKAAHKREKRQLREAEPSSGTQVATDDELAAFYKGLLAAEARHHGMYVDLARELAPESEVRERLAALAAIEADILKHPADEPRMHS